MYSAEHPICRKVWRRGSEKKAFNLIETQMTFSVGEKWEHFLAFLQASFPNKDSSSSSPRVLWLQFMRTDPFCLPKASSEHGCEFYSRTPWAIVPELRGRPDRLFCPSTSGYLSYGLDNHNKSGNPLGVQLYVQTRGWQFASGALPHCSCDVSFEVSPSLQERVGYQSFAKRAQAVC